LKTENDAVISASTVRALLDTRDWDGIRELVPDITFKYLWDRFGACPLN